MACGGYGVRKAETIVLGCAGTLLLCCLMALALVAFTDFAPRFIQKRVRLAGQARALEDLSKKYPFTPATGDGVRESRLKAFLEASCSAKGAAARLEEWEKANGETHGREDGIFRGGSPDLVADFLAALEGGLKAQEMGPDEFLWIADRMGLAAKGPPPPDELARARAEAGRLRAEADDVRTRPKLRRHDLRVLEAMNLTGQLWSPADEADHALYLRYEERIGACGLGRRALDILYNAGGMDPGKKRSRVIVEDEPGPAPVSDQSPPGS